MAINPTEIVDIPKDINKGLSSPSNKTLLQILGMPRDVITAKCREPNMQPMQSLVTKSTNVGPFNVRGIRPAVASLKRVMKDVKKSNPEVHKVLSTAGMLCVRTIKNSSKISNHSWGCAVDIRVGGILDGLGSGGHDGKTLAGLVAMAPHFHAEGWYWGVGFSSFEDGMHFEIAEETLRKWHSDGTLGKRVGKRTATPSSVAKGDSGKRVRDIQKALADRGYDILPDGEFGPITEGIVFDFQLDNGLEPDGIVGPKTMKALFA